MTDLEEERQHNLAETFGAAASHSDYKVGEHIRYRLSNETIVSGEIIWCAAPALPGLSGNADLPLRYVVAKDEMECGFPDIVHSGDFVGEGEEPTLEKCKWCSEHHYKGQEQYCDRNPTRGMTRIV